MIYCEPGCNCSICSNIHSSIITEQIRKDLMLRKTCKDGTEISIRSISEENILEGYITYHPTTKPTPTTFNIQELKEWISIHDKEIPNTIKNKLFDLGFEEYDN